MEKKISKYLNGTANPEEFSEVVEALCAESNDEKVSLELLKFWKEALDSAIHNKENSQFYTQQELVSMVRDGVLNKAGLKRWSRYFVK